MVTNFKFARDPGPNKPLHLTAAALRFFRVHRLATRRSR
jgi:hypothetical protein